MVEVKRLNKNDVVFWSKPKRIKDNWLNAVIEKPIFKDKNIQFIMKCNFNELSYIVVSQKEIGSEEIQKINLNDYIFEGLGNFSRGLKKKEGIA